jgi:flagellar biogenesis protein FliO
VLVEERGGDEKDRLARVAGRGREDAAPAALQFGVAAAVGALVLVILVVALLLWVLIR